jgi:hypothetical protein
VKGSAAFLPAIGLLAMASCDGGEPPLYSVAELVPRIDELNGKTVRVAGYLGDCGGYSCELFPSKEDLAVWRRAYDDLRKGNRPKLPDSPVLGIGSGDEFEFDAKAAPFTSRYVVITGKVDNRCRFNGQRGCTDRSPDLDPTGIAPWNGPVPPPPQQKSIKA